jgi:hypothetical protein
MLFSFFFLAAFQYRCLFWLPENASTAGFHHSFIHLVFVDLRRMIDTPCSFHKPFLLHILWIQFNSDTEQSSAPARLK